MYNTSTESKDSFVRIRLREFYTSAAGIIIPIDDSKVYLPERSWTKTFAEGLQKISLAGSCVLEVGVGSGINMAGLILGKTPPRDFIGTDIAHDAVSASAALAAEHSMQARLLQSDLLDGVDSKTLEQISDIVGCIPQVPRHKCEIATDREKSDYYEETGIKEDAFGLGLVARLLDQTIARAPQARVTLNIAGRPGAERITDLFADRSMNHEIIHRRVVQQDPTTSLASLAEIEQESGVDFHFYKDAEGKKEIGASEAEKLRADAVPIYHNLYVIQARL